jgi:hypothetical protein
MQLNPLEIAANHEIQSKEVVTNHATKKGISAAS